MPTIRISDGNLERLKKFRQHEREIVDDLVTHALDKAEGTPVTTEPVNS